MLTQSNLKKKIPLTKCPKCGRTSKVVDMKKCPFCSPEKSKAPWEDCKAISKLSLEKSKPDWENRIEDILRNRILDITGEYRGRKYEKGVQVYLDYPQLLIDELNKEIRTLLQSEREKIIGEVKNWAIKYKGYAVESNKKLLEFLATLK